MSGGTKGKVIQCDHLKTTVGIVVLMSTLLAALEECFMTILVMVDLPRSNNRAVKGEKR